MPNDSVEPTPSATTILPAGHSRPSASHLAPRDTAEHRVTLYLTLTTTPVGVSVAVWQIFFPPTKIRYNRLWQ